MQLLDYSMDKDLKPPANFDYIRGEMAADLGTAAPQQAALLIQNSSPISAATELYIATAAAAHADKPDLALHWLNQLRARYQSDNASAGNHDLGDVTSAVIQLIGPKNPAKALELARMITDKQESARCLMLAATYQSKPIALAVFNELFKSSPQTNYVNPFHLAAMIYNLDTRRGKVLFDELLKKYQQQRKEFFNSGRNISALDESLAYYMARYKLTVSWEILQNAHAKSKQQPPQDNFYNRNYSQIPLAMSALNFDEAMRWARELPPQTNPLNNSNNSANTQFRLLQIALATPQARRTLDFDNPNAFNS